MPADVQPSTLQQFYRGRRVLVTGHTGFKGAWLTLWLARMGAEVSAFALAPDQGPDNLFDRASVASGINSAEIDLRDAAAVLDFVQAAQPELVFHLGARAWVQQGYEDPLGTFAVNTLGTAHVLDAARRTGSVRAVVCVTTDKVYRNLETGRPFAEDDELGGSDPYSASKAAAELVARCYGEALAPADRRMGLATARGGNVIGGGDWSPHRIVPDIVRAIRSEEPLRLRLPNAERPWQHVLDICHAYLLLGRRLAEADGSNDPGPAWNFGPAIGSETTVAELVRRFLDAWGRPDYPVEHARAPHYESKVLRLDPTRADERLGWRPLLGRDETIGWTAEWYRDYLTGADASARRLAEKQIDRFETTVTELAEPARRAAD